MLNGLDLFSGIGGIGFALNPWVRTVAYCEQDRYAQAVLLSRMSSGDIDRAPIWDDVRTLRGDQLPRVDIIFGGFPCQDLSVAGAGAGLAGERSGLFYEVARLVRECQPTYVFLENVPAIRTRGGERVVKELASLGYDCRWTTLSAAEVGAPHKRDRWWLLAADTKRINLRLESGWSGGTCGAEAAQLGLNGQARPLADGDGEGLEVGLQGNARQLKTSFGGSWWEFEPDVGRVAHGIPQRVDRIRGLGNSVVPQAAREAFIRLSGIGG